jgi:hypothetical protein
MVCYVFVNTFFSGRNNVQVGFRAGSHNYGSMERLDQCHLHPKLEVPQDGHVPAGIRTRASGVGCER